MRSVNLVLLCALVATLLAAQNKQRTLPPRTPAKGERTFTGRITDSMCARADHKAMGMGDTDGECTKACVLSHGAQYVLFDGTNVYTFSDQKAPEAFAGMKVSVTGTLDAKNATLKTSAIKAVK